MKAIVGAGTDVGRVRDGNEDSYLVQEPLFAVADGMGGHLAGDVASQTAIQTIVDKAGDSGLTAKGDLGELVREANVAIWSKAQGEPSLRGMGTTCTLLFVEDSAAHIAHVGDSRAYLFRNGSLSQLTEDHTLVGRMVKEGRLRPEEAERHPQRSVITRALGVDPEVSVDVSSVELEEGDRILVCSDGLTSMVSPEAIGEVLSKERAPQAAVERLIALANEAGGEDNITVVLLAFVADDEVAPAAGSAPVRVDTEPGEPKARREGPRPRKGSTATRAVLSTVVIVAVLVAGAWLVFRYVIVANSYYVGINDQDMITIYQGLREDVAGLDLSKEEEVSTIALADLPAFLQEDVRNGIEADSKQDALRTVANLEDRARDAEFDRAPDKERSRDSDRARDPNERETDEQS